jgi:peptide/nickel transport system substrate-binding protein
MESSYWSRQRVGRRTVIRGAGLGVAGLAGAALIGCGGGDDGTATPVVSNTLDATAVPTAEAGATPVPASEVRVKPGLYAGPIPPSAAELNPGVNAKFGGVLKWTYLDPPRMDLARTLSCTIFHTLTYTSNRLTRAKLGATADPYRVEIEPDLAESWEALDGGQTFVFHLRKGVKMHNKAPVNGREFVSDDVRGTYEIYRRGSQQDVFNVVERLETPDNHTVIFKLNQPLSDFPLNLGAWSWMYPRELVDNEELRQQVSVGTGPFIQKEWINKEKSVFERHPDYFEVDSEGRQLPYLDGIEAYVQDDANALRSGFQTDNYMAFSARDQSDIEEQLRRRPDTVIASTTPVSRGANVNGWQYQMKNPIYQDERVRRALSLALDRDEFDLARFNGDNANPKGAFSQAPMPWPMMFEEYPTRADNGPWYQFNPAEASKMMQAAGYTAQNPLEDELVSWYNRVEFAELAIPAISQNLPEVKLTFRQIDNPTHVTVMSSRDFTSMIGFLWGPPGYSMDQWLYPFYHSAASLNYGSINDPILDDLLVKQRREADPVAQRAIWGDIWDLIHNQVYQAWWPVGFARYTQHNYVLNNRYHGLVGAHSCYSSDQARAIWLDDGAPGVRR